MRLDGKITHGMVMDVESVGADNISFVFGPVGSYIDPSIYYTKEEIDAMLANVGVQSDWNVTDTSSKAYIKHKPTIPAAPVQSDWNESDSTSLAYIKNKPGPTSQVQSDWSQNDSTAVDYIKNKPTIPDAQIQADWNQTTNTAKDYIKNKPTIPAAQVNADWDAASGVAQILNKPTIPDLATYCPIIEDTRSSSVAAITGVAPFSELVDGQRIVLHLAFPNLSNPTLQLTLSNGTPTSAYNIYGQIGTNVMRLTLGYYRAEVYLPMIFASNRWNVIADANTQYDSLTQALLNVGTDMSNRLISPKLIHDNAYIVEETYSSGSLKANKMYDFGEVTTALTIPDLDATNDLVSGVMNFWALHFIVGTLTPAGTTELSITFPQNPSDNTKEIIVDNEPTIKEGDYVEIMITKHTVSNVTEYYASIKVWQAQSQNS